jgi:hypothetical protein
MRRYFIVATIFAWLTGLQYANADWQYTNWEMTPDQVIAASGGKSVRDDTPSSGKGPNRRLLKGDYTSGQFHFRVEFYFNENTNRLSLVQLQLLDPGLGYTLEQSLISKYGKPLEAHPGVIRITRWQDASNNNRVELLHIESRSVSLRYFPLRTTDNKGL